MRAGRLEVMILLFIVMVTAGCQAAEWVQVKSCRSFDPSSDDLPRALWSADLTAEVVMVAVGNDDAVLLYLEREEKAKLVLLDRLSGRTLGSCAVRPSLHRGGYRPENQGFSVLYEDGDGGVLAARVDDGRCDSRFHFPEPYPWGSLSSLSPGTHHPWSCDDYRGEVVLEKSNAGWLLVVNLIESR